MFHHRNPTSTDNVYNACHPISTRSGTGNSLEKTYIGVHNGVIYNTADLKKAHEELGVQYVTSQKDGKFNDSEALIWDLALFFEGKKEFEARGGMAWIVMQLGEDGKPEKLHFGRNSNPLNIHRKHGKYLTLSSEGPGEATLAETHYIFDYATQEYEKIPMDMTRTKWSTGETGKSVVPFRGATNHYDHDFTGDTTVVKLALANCAYRNGHFNNNGVWVPKVASQPMGFPLGRMTSSRLTPTGATTTRDDSLTSLRITDIKGTAGGPPFGPEYMAKLSSLVDSSVVDSYCAQIVQAADYEILDVIRVCENRYAKTAGKTRKLRIQMVYRGPVFLDQKTFERLDQTLFSAEVDLYIIWRVLARVRLFQASDMHEFVARQQQKEVVA